MSTNDNPEPSEAEKSLLDDLDAQSNWHFDKEGRAYALELIRAHVAKAQADLRAENAEIVASLREMRRLIRNCVSNHHARQWAEELDVVDELLAKHASRQEARE